ncbi:hypothetical protein B0J13DRAFT_546752 [Dactylonectria estremocensis]|uniref:Chitin-binding type-4 domain-containing protein n=1 Tax=Dactylonectria estremocensis TaxID=1079267 RepID=A0A9P9F3U7_9HYPO|nr:hypothetical protein B0J13DRAFT_546752 [Dactylonectria estremocensis]
MARHLVHSLFATSLLSSLALAGPCHVSSHPTPTPTPPTCPSTPDPICDPNPQSFCAPNPEPECTTNFYNPIVNGNFETGSLCPWKLSADNEVCGYVGDQGADGTSHAFRTPTNMRDNNYLEMYQDIKTCGRAKVQCSYSWYWDKYYNADGYVPYVRIWNDNENVGNRFPESDDDAGYFHNVQTIEFYTPESGRARIWITAQSPQDRCVGDNWFSIDEFQCWAIAAPLDPGPGPDPEPTPQPTPEPTPQPTPQPTPAFPPIFGGGDAPTG